MQHNRLMANSNGILSVACFIVVVIAFIFLRSYNGSTFMIATGSFAAGYNLAVWLAFRWRIA